MLTVWVAMGAGNFKEQQETNQRLARIEDRLGINDNGASPTADGKKPLAPSPPRDGPKDGAKPKPKRAAVFVDEPEGDGKGDSTSPMAHGSPAGPKMQARAHEKQAGFGANVEEPAGAAKPADAGAGHAKKAAAAKAKEQRSAFFDPLVFEGEWKDVPRAAGIKSVWLAAAALGLSYTADEKIRLEDVLRTNEMALHYVSMPSVTLAELFDTCNDYLRSSKTLRDTVHCEVATFDTETVEEVDEDEVATVGDRGPIQSLIQFRKALSAEMADESRSVHIFNFDPFPVQEAEAKAAEDEEDIDEDDEEAMNSSQQEKGKAQQWNKKNMGHFAILTHYHAALHTVTLSTVHVGPEGNFVLENHQCPLQVLYNACCAKDGYTKRSRGFVRIFRSDDANRAAVKSKYPVSVIDGREGRGMLSISLDISIAPHILGLGIFHTVVDHALAVQADTAEDAMAASGLGFSTGGVALRGIPVTDICSRLALPVGVICDQSTRESLPLAAVWYRHYMSRVAKANCVDIGLVQITRRDDSEDGAVNVDEDDFTAFIKDAAASQDALVLLSFNINTALNVRVIPTTQSPSHFAILTGYDEQSGVVQLADVSVKKFRKQWHTTVALLHAAVIGHGYVCVAKKGSELAARHDGVEKLEAASTLAKYRVHPHSTKQFEYPRKNYSATMVAAALNRIGAGSKQVTVEAVMNCSGFHVSFMLSEHLPLLSVQRVTAYFAQHHLDNAVHSVATSADAPIDKAAFVAKVKESLVDDKGRPTSVILVNYSGAGLHRYPAVWNGSFGGNLAMIVGYNAKADELLLQDSNPEPFYREWACPVDVLLQMMTETDSIADRARGFIEIKRGANPLLKDGRGLDLRRAQSHHPFKNPVSSFASAVAFALSELIPGSAVSVEDVVYSAGDFALTTLTSKVEAADAIKMANDWLAQNPTHRKSIKVEGGAVKLDSADKLFEAIAHKENRITVIIYKTSAVFASTVERGLAAAVVNRAKKGDDIVVCDGSPTRHGDMWSRPAAKLFEAVQGVIHIAKQ